MTNLSARNEMESSELRIAILHRGHPNRVESFIEAHRTYLRGNVLFISGGLIPEISEVDGNIHNYLERTWKRRIARLLPVFLYNRCMGWDRAHSDLEVYLKRKRVDVVLAEYGMTGAENLSVFKRLKIPLVVHFHGFDASVTEVVESYRERYQEMFAYAFSVIAVSTAMKRALIAMGCPCSKITASPYGPNPEFFDVQPRFEKKQFVAWGRFVDKKAPYYVLLAFKNLLEKHPDAELVMGGDGGLKGATENLARYYGIEDRVRFPGLGAREDFIGLLKDSIGFVQHSVVAADGDSEGTPVAILEASAAGVPVISTRHAGIPDVVQHEETGYLVDEHDVLGMTHYMETLCRDFDLARRMGANASKRIAHHFSMEKHIAALNRVLEDAATMAPRY